MNPKSGQKSFKAKTGYVDCKLQNDFNPYPANVENMVSS